jgi:hypothetical protein
MEERVTHRTLQRLLMAVAAAGLVGCGSKDPTSPLLPADPAWPFFAPDHVTEVAIEIDDASWEALRHQSRTWFDIVAGENKACMTQPFQTPFTWFTGSVTVDGVRRDEVGLRKKGFAGSINPDRPALKLKFDHVRPDQTLYGLTRLTLNNSVQDPSWLRQCLSYEVFAKAGIPAPWCNFAHVTVNGRDLGLYVNIEAYDHRWLRRNFVRDEGDLWEGTLSDFRPGWMDTFEKKGNIDDADQTSVDRSSLVEVSDIARAGWTGWELRDRLAKLIDFDEFMRLWATERILDHWDGYASQANNYFIYKNPADHRFVFIPYGTDQIGGIRDNVDTVRAPASVYTGAILTNRLYAGQGTTRQLYADTLLKTLDSAFHEDELLTEIDRMQALVTPVLARAGADLGAQAQAVDQLRAWISGRRAAILADLRNGPPDWQQTLKDTWCVDLAGRLEGSFATTFGSNAAPDAFRTGTGVINGTYRGHSLGIHTVGVQAGYHTDAQAQWVLVHLVGASTDATYYDVNIYVNPAQFRPGIQGYAGGELGNWNPATGRWSYMGGLVDGWLELDAASLQPGAPVSGRFKAIKVIRW